MSERLPTEEIAGCRAAHLRLFATLDELPPDGASMASKLPGWTVGHVLAHLAQNAEAMLRRIEAARVGRVVEQYSGGPAGRAEQIAVGAERPTDELVTDVKASAVELDELFASLDADAWHLEVRTVAGGSHTIERLPFRRWREVEVHHLDLGASFGVHDLSPDLVDRALPRLIASLDRRTDRSVLTAWLLGRGESPTLDAWG